MTAILRILEDGDLKWEVALTGVQRIGGVTFYELDLADVPYVGGTKELPRQPPAGDRRRDAVDDDGKLYNPIDDQHDPDGEHTP